MQRAYLHGFASGPLSKKGVVLAQAFEARGMPFFRPDLNVPSFATLSVRAMIAEVEKLDREHGDAEGWGFVGSSLGGWLAARFAELHPDRVARLVLLCPAFDIASRWTTVMKPGAMETWRREGTILTEDGSGMPTALHYRFYEEACDEPAYPDVRCETILIHGVRDERVPIEGSRRYAASHPNVELVEVDDVHDLLASQALVVDRALDFLG